MIRVLDKKTITAWRDFAQTEEFDNGLAHLRQVKVPKPKRGDGPDAVAHDSFAAAGFNEALDLIESYLTQYEPEEQPDPRLPELQR